MAGSADYPAPLQRVAKGAYRTCSLPGCGRPHRSKGLCQQHYQRQWAGLPLDGGIPRGETHGNAKLTGDAVRRIRRLAADGASTAALAREFGVSWKSVDSVLRRRTWAHID